MDPLSEANTLFQSFCKNIIHLERSTLRYEGSESIHTGVYYFFGLVF